MYRPCPLASCPSISLGQFALCRESLLKVRTPNHQHWSCCFTVSPEKSGLSDLIRALFTGGTPLLARDEPLPLKRNLPQIKPAAHRDYIPAVNLSYSLPPLLAWLLQPLHEKGNPLKQILSAGVRLCFPMQGRRLWPQGGQFRWPRGLAWSSQVSNPRALPGSSCGSKPETRQT